MRSLLTDQSRQPPFRPMPRYDALLALLSAVRVCVVLCLVTTMPAESSAQLPRARLFAVFPAGGQQGTTVDVNLASGADLEDVTRLVFSHSGITLASAQDDPTDGQKKSDGKTFPVAIDSTVPPGFYEIRALGRNGVSNPRCFMVSGRPEIVEKEPNNELQQAQPIKPGVMVNGRCEGGRDVDCYALDLKAGQRLLLQCWAERIDSRMDATLVLFGPHGQEIVGNRDYVGRDPLIDFTAAADGRYVVKVSDFLYREGKEYVYRFCAGTAPRIEFIFPPIGQPSRRQSFTLFGRNLPGGRPVRDVTVDGIALEKLRIDATLPARGMRQDAQTCDRLLQLRDVGMEGMEFRLASPQGESNSVSIGLATEHVVVEHEPNNDAKQAQHIILPCELVGQFATRGDRDWFEFDVVKDEQFWFEVISQGHGLPVDPFVVLQRVLPGDGDGERVSDVKELDDSTQGNWSKAWTGAASDPIYEFKSPGSGTYRLMIRDLYADSRGSPRLVYRLAIRRPRPDFQLVAMAQGARPKDNSNYEPASPLLRPGGASAISVFAVRRHGFRGAVELAVDGLPQGVTCDPCVLGPGVISTMLVLHADDQTDAWCGPITVVGKARVGDRQVTRRASTASLTWSVPGNDSNQRPTRLSRDMVLAVSGHEKAACVIHVGDQTVVEAERSGKVTLPVKVERQVGAKHPIKLTPHFLPPNVKGKEITIAGDKSEGVLELQIAKNAPIGEFAVSLRARTQLDYRRNQAVVDEADRALQQAKQHADQSSVASQAALAAKEAAERAQQQSAERLDQASQALARAEIEYRGAQAHANAMRALRDAAVKAAAEQPQNKAPADAAQFAKQVTEEAEKNEQSIQLRLTSARQALPEARAAVETARKKLAATRVAADEALARQKNAQEAHQVAEKRAKEVNEANKPQKKDVALTSNSIRFRIKPPPKSDG